MVLSTLKQNRGRGEKREREERDTTERGKRRGSPLKRDDILGQYSRGKKESDI